MPPVAAGGVGGRPMVVWTITRRCNLRCLYCPSDSSNRPYPGELTTDEAKRVIDDLAGFGVPGVVVSGGEPLMRPDIFELAAHAQHRGLPVGLHTNGTLIDRRAALRLKAVGVVRVEVSLDGMGGTNDQFRGVRGAFERARAGIRNCLQVGQEVGLRLTASRHAIRELDQLFDFIEAEGIRRVAFARRITPGRGRDLARDEPSPREVRQALDTILARTREPNGLGLRARQQRDKAGAGTGNIDWLGDVHPSPLRPDITLGNVKERGFSEIWQEAYHSIHPVPDGLDGEREP